LSFDRIVARKDPEMVGVTLVTKGDHDSIGLPPNRQALRGRFEHRSQVKRGTNGLANLEEEEMLLRLA
jgi:hypothetical protein